ncbi:MAG: hypothetical protein ONB44_23795 [candidate division KSB1 bacterium]|nr:hypothetical protein [candidate division KSB1 bacterium]MDZ7305167.1 hypothetical protein [candidate division KSB1 bacterium]MDZ7312938.1 hypothetical protein [candidate division KSB1 bacterium]
MNQGLAVVIGLSIAYLASFAGMIFAYLYYKKYKGKGAPQRSSPERREA